MKLWSIALFLFILGFATSSINDLGFLNTKIPGAQYQGVTEENVKDVSSQVMFTGLNPFFMYFVIQTFMKAMVSGFLAILSILPLFCSILSGFGIPLAYSIPIGMLFQGPVWYVELNGVYQLITGHTEQGME